MPVCYPKTSARGLWSQYSTQKHQPRPLEPNQYPKSQVSDMRGLSGTQRFQSGASRASPVPKNSSQRPLEPVWYPKTSATGLWSQFSAQKFQLRASGASPVLKKSSHRPLERVQYQKSSSQGPLEPVWYPKTLVRGLWSQSSWVNINKMSGVSMNKNN